MEEKRNIQQFELANSSMVAASASAYQSDTGFNFGARTQTYSQKDAQQIIAEGGLAEKIALSNHFYNLDGVYKKIVLYYATLLNYTGIVIPHTQKPDLLSKDFVLKKYNQAVKFMDMPGWKTFCIKCAETAILEGTYYGLIKNEKDSFTVLDLPSKYCRTRYKDKNGNNLIEFDVRFFTSISDEQVRKNTLKSYPARVRSWYTSYDNGGKDTPWVFVPVEESICISMLGDTPLFLSIINDIYERDSRAQIEKARDVEEISKIVTVEMPHTQDGKLVFEPEEVAIMHKGLVQMLKGNANTRVLTTYGKVDSVTSKGQLGAARNTAEQMNKNIFNKAGVSGLLFGEAGSASLMYSIENDISIMMSFAEQLNLFVTNLLNRKFSNSNITFTYKILPITLYNQKDYITSTLKMANSGYSFLVPALAVGLSQSEFISLKTLENEVYDLKSIMQPLSNSFSESSDNAATDEGGVKAKEGDQKAETTVTKDESLD